MSAPRTKRQFAGASSDPAQRQITSFFTTSSSSASATPPPSSQQLAPIPASVQTNLLSVGMRVRKSVPEGYKTGSYSAFKLWSDAAIPSSKPLPAFKAPAQRELLPFCGIHNVGGFASQPAPADDDYDYDGSMAEVPDIDDVPGLTSSQESVESTVATSSRKRIHDDDEENAETESLQVPARFQARGSWADGDVSPRSLTPVGWPNARPMAVPRRLGRRKHSTLAHGSEQENVDDFDEADFLVGEGMDLTGA